MTRRSCGGTGQRGFDVAAPQSVEVLQHVSENGMGYNSLETAGYTHKVTIFEDYGGGAGRKYRGLPHVADGRLISPDRGWPRHGSPCVANGLTLGMSSCVYRLVAAAITNELKRGGGRPAGRYGDGTQGVDRERAAPARGGTGGNPFVYRAKRKISSTSFSASFTKLPSGWLRVPFFAISAR